MTDQIRLEKGDTAPAFTLPNDKGEQVSLADFAGQRVIVYFYPRANTPGCTTEACDFTEKLDEFSNAKVTVIGISPDPTEKLADFRAKHDLGVELLGDEASTATGGRGQCAHTGPNSQKAGPIGFAKSPVATK